MKKNRRFSFFPSLSDKLLILVTLGMVVFGSFMVMSAEMGVAAGETSVITKTAIRQIAFFIAGLIAMGFLSKVRVLDFNINLYWIGYFVILCALLSTRLFGSTNGAYAWIRIGSLASIQPSEFAKIFIMLMGAKLLSRNRPSQNRHNFLTFIVLAAIYFVVIVFYQKDLGSGVVLAGICFVIMLVPPYKEYNTYHLRMFLLLIVGFAGMLFLLSPLGTKLLEKFSGSYKVARFLASSNPFAYQYDSGYHVIMGLVSFATGGWFGLGYGQSIHKYMNFPNPSTDFILPVIVEEMGIILGLLPILAGYVIMFYKLYKYGIKSELVSSKMILLGTFTYIAIHFVLNIGGVSGLVPLTGVPLLLISSGGSSTVATMCAIGICEGEIVNYRKGLVEENEDSSRKV